MARVSDLLVIKGNHVFSIGLRAKVIDAALLMNEHKIGALVVIDDGRVLGMFTERDVLQRVVAEHRDPDHATVEEVMTKDVIVCTAETSLEEARSAMKNHRIRHMPVVNGNQRVQGLISIGDLNAYQTSDQEQTIHHLHEYLYGRV